MSIGRIIKNGRGFEFVELDELEQESVIGTAIQRNLSLYMRIEKAVSDFLLKRHILDPHGLQQRLSLVIFEAVAVKSGMLLHAELCRKIRIIKEDGEA